MTGTTAADVPELAYEGPKLILPASAPRDDWLRERRSGIGGSDVAAILGIGPKGPTRVFYEKTGAIGPGPESPKMEWGRRHEAAVLRKFADEHPELCVTPGPGLVADPHQPWRRATVDGLVRQSPDGPVVAIVEVKTSATRPDHDHGEVRWGEPGTDQVPYPYLCQAMWYLDIYGCGHLYVAALIDGFDYREYVVRYDPELARRLREHCEAFWVNHVSTGIPPDVDALPDTARALSQLHHARAVRDTRGELPTVALDWARVYARAHADERRARERKEEAANHLRQAFVAAGNTHYGYVDGRKVASWSPGATRTRAVFDEKAFAEDHPDLHARYLRTEPYELTPRLTVARDLLEEK